MTQHSQLLVYLKRNSDVQPSLDPSQMLVMFQSYLERVKQQVLLVRQMCQKNDLVAVVGEKAEYVKLLRNVLQLMNRATMPRLLTCYLAPDSGVQISFDPMVNAARLLASSHENIEDQPMNTLQKLNQAAIGIQLKGKLSAKSVAVMEKIPKRNAQFLLRRLYDQRMQQLFTICRNQRKKIVKLSQQLARMRQNSEDDFSQTFDKLVDAKFNQLKSKSGSQDSENDYVGIQYCEFLSSFDADDLPGVQESGEYKPDFLELPQKNSKDINFASKTVKNKKKRLSNYLPRPRFKLDSSLNKSKNFEALKIEDEDQPYNNSSIDNISQQSITQDLEDLRSIQNNEIEDDVNSIANVLRDYNATTIYGTNQSQLI